MALTKCRECGTEISSKAESCPKCGARILTKSEGIGTFLGLFIFGIIILATILKMVITLSTSTASSPPSSTVSSPPSSTVLFPSSSTASTFNAQTPSVLETQIVGSQWHYENWKDEMSSGWVYTASVLSSNTMEFGFPYSGEQNARLTLRTHPRYGKGIIFAIEKGQILCHSYEDCDVLVRFDDEPPANYSARGPADHSNHTTFISGYDRFVRKMLKAKRVRISVGIFREGAPVCEFDVSGFDQSKYIPNN